MALQTTGSISISQIKVQLGSSYNSLWELTYVADATKFVNGNRTAPYAMSEFYGYPKATTGVTYVTVTLSPVTVGYDLAESLGFSYRIGSGNDIFITEQRILSVPNTETIYVTASALFLTDYKRIILKAGSTFGGSNYGQQIGTGSAGQQNLNLTVSLSGKSQVYFEAYCEAY